MERVEWHERGRTANPTTGLCALVCAALACGPPAPTYDPLDHLQVGADPRSEAAQLEAHFADQGFERSRRVERGGAIALRFDHPDGRRVLRVVSRRGVVLGLDAPNERAQRVDLLDLPLRDLDADGEEDLVISAEDAAHGRVCHAILRVRPDGGLEEVTARMRIPARACLESLRVEGARAVGVVVLRYPELAAGRVPSAPRTHRGPRWTLSVDASNVRARRAALGEADAREAHHLGVELAALAGFGGADEGAQRATYDAAVAPFASALPADLVERTQRFIDEGCLVRACGEPEPGAPETDASGEPDDD